MTSSPSSSEQTATLRDIIAIDETLCNGCGKCLISCAEGALAIVDGKVKVISDIMCDGLGACLGACPQGALRIERRKAQPFDASAAASPATHSCPGLSDSGAAVPSASHVSSVSLENRHWPLKLQLTPPDKPFLHNAHLALTADCAPASCPNFAARYLPGKVMLLTCAKLEDKQTIVDRLAELFRVNPPADITLIRMEVPCCCLPDLVRKAQEVAGTDIPCHTTILTRFGQENLPGFGKGSHHGG